MCDFFWRRVSQRVEFVGERDDGEKSVVSHTTTTTIIFIIQNREEEENISKRGG